MRLVSAVAVGATVGALIYGLTTMKPELPEPGIEQQEIQQLTKEITQQDTAWGRIKHIRYIPAEDDSRFEDALMEMTEWCGEKGLPAEVWVERNAKGKLEVLGRCTKTFRSEGP